VSNQFLYWIYMGIAAAVPFVLGIWLMRKTNKLAFSFWISTILNVLIIGAAMFWWASVNEEQFMITFGNAFYVIAAVNVAVIELFALVSMRKKSNL
jgi:hypothetical protein